MDTNCKIELQNAILKNDSKSWNDYVAVQNRYNQKIDLSSVGLSSNIITDFNFENADFSEVSFIDCSFHKCNFSKATFNEGSLVNCNFLDCNFSDTVCKHVSFEGVCFNIAKMYQTVLANSIFKFCTFISCKIVASEFHSVSFETSTFIKTSLNGIIYNETTVFPNTKLPEGGFIGWKILEGRHIAKLYIPSKAKRVMPIGSRKCRAEFVKVLAIYEFGTNNLINVGYGYYETFFKYTVGAVIYPGDFDGSILKECTDGIHFFLTRKEAEEYV
jgi:hypothetical protein